MFKKLSFLLWVVPGAAWTILLHRGLSFTGGRHTAFAIAVNFAFALIVLLFCTLEANRNTRFFRLLNRLVRGFVVLLGMVVAAGAVYCRTTKSSVGQDAFEAILQSNGKEILHFLVDQVFSPLLLLAVLGAGVASWLLPTLFFRFAPRLRLSGIKVYAVPALLAAAIFFYRLNSTR